jgi:hypothetical protein
MSKAHFNRLRSHCQWPLDEYASFSETKKEEEVNKLKQIIMDRAEEEGIDVKGFVFDVRFVNSLYVRLVPKKEEPKKANGKAEKKGSKKKEVKAKGKQKPKEEKAVTIVSTENFVEKVSAGITMTDRPTSIYRKWPDEKKVKEKAEQHETPKSLLN